jgi:flagellar biosynthesis protein FliP
MSRRKTSSVGAFHPILFFVVIYGISLFLAFFVCSSVYYSINDNEEVRTETASQQQQYELDNTTAATALR